MPADTLPPSSAAADLARVWRRFEGDPDAAIRAITETGGRALDVARVSVWLLDEVVAGLRCIDLWEAGTHRQGNGTVLRAFDFPAYFAAALEADTLAVEDAHVDARTAELSAPYLRPHGIGALLDAPIRNGRRLVGVLSHEHVGGSRAWSEADRKEAVLLAALAALTLEVKSRARCEALLAATIEPAPEGLLATDAERVIAFNQRFVEMWRIDGATMRSFDAVRKHIEARTRRRGPLDGGDAHELELVDGRVFELSSRPQLAADRVVGTVWSFRDVTAQRRRTS